ncbi:spore germination lipoprotein GerD [Paenibacillus eucommiae]|uniref:Spore germination protein D n=1 Tax=Paenibacillus eucommiae TaxID=1355755 RepID=A0ABS4JAX2_9BACL|nr:spore germination lipoprotein GerD [Paenibacillus eucommiae]MBP1996391.1 spore germination protein D [Paenibacillus eucommiae]
MIRKWHSLIPLVLMTLLVTSCGSGSSSGSQGPGYKETKTMVMDILKSEDGKKAIKTAQESGGGSGAGGSSQIKLLSAEDSSHLQMAVKDVLVAQENNKFLQDLMKDPKFAGDFAKAIQKETKQMQKDLLKDPEYQKQLLDTMKNPEYEKLLMDTMKQAQYRQQMMTVIQESMQSPLFRADLVELLKTALKQQTESGGKSGGSGQGSGSGQEKSSNSEGQNM